jgi:hypothetical protein
MASVVKRARKGGAHYQVTWRLGGAREGAWQSETFTDGRAAAKFKADVEAYDHAWPDGWVQGAWISHCAVPGPHRRKRARLSRIRNPV